MTEPRSGMSKREIVRVLENMARLLEMREANAFEVLAFRNGAERFLEWEGDFEELLREDRLTEIEGIGKGLEKVIRELAIDGRSPEFEELHEGFPESIFELFQVSGLGAKKVKRLHAELGIDDLSSLEDAAKSERIRALKGFGAKSEEKILAALPYARRRLEEK